MAAPKVACSMGSHCTGRPFGSASKGGKENMDVSGFRQVRVIPRRLLLQLGAVGLALSILAASASAAAADRPSHCSGSFASPGVLAGTYDSNVTVEGACVVNAGPALIEGNLTVGPGAGLLGGFP